MAPQSPTISIPKKTTEEVDWTTPIQSLIAQSYGERPDNYAQECVNLQKCRQDAVRGAGSDMTGRDLLYKYFGQLELLELRFSEIRVPFPWHDAFTNKLTTQTSLAFEKASIIFQIASTHSSIASAQNRSDPEGLKRAFHYFRTCAGMLTYINDNFLHAPSTDLSREVVKFLVGIMLAQATEVFFDKCVDEKKGNALVAKVAAQAAFLYGGLNEEVKEFMGKGIFDRNWVTLIQVKAKYFTSLMHHYRALADDTAGRHGDALVRFQIAETNAKEANRSANTLTSYFVTGLSPTLPSDAASSMLELTKTHLALCTERKTTAQKDNDLIYNAVLPSESTLPAVDKLSVATAIPIQEVYGTPDVQKTIGPDLFARLIPLSVHEGASVYSEEKAKLVRGEVEKADIADEEVKASLVSIGVKEGLGRFREMVENMDDIDPVPPIVRKWKEEIDIGEIERQLRELERLREGVRGELEGVKGELEVESRECEMMRVKYEHLWTQEPSAPLTKSLRQDLKSHLSALEQAYSSDRQVVALWESVRGDIGILCSDSIDGLFVMKGSGESAGVVKDLLDADVGGDEEERKRIADVVKEIDERLGRINKLGRERNETLKDLKEKVQSDDVSHILLLNRRGQSVDSSLFAAELEKFRPYQQRIALSVASQQSTIQEVATLWKGLKDVASRGAGAKKWEERERKKMEVVKRFARARDGWMEVKEGLAKGLQFYRDLSDLSNSLRRSITSFITGRKVERDGLIANADTQQRLAAISPSRSPNLSSRGQDLDGVMSKLSLGTSTPTGSRWSDPSRPPLPPPPPPQLSYSNPLPPSSQNSSPYPPPPPPPRQSSYSSPVQPTSTGYSSPSLPPPPPPAPPRDPYASLFSTPGLSNQFSLDSPQPSVPQSQPSQYGHSQPQQSQYSYQSYPPPPPQPPRQQTLNTGASSWMQQQQSPLYRQDQVSSPSGQQSPYPPPPPSGGPGYGSYGQQPPQFQQPGQNQMYQPYPPPPPQPQNTQSSQNQQAWGQYGGYGR
ncbi:BRO1-domain-containing protein [Sistotremastrum niveocremeum HHB9708]|uniref:BRO domain-containing protein 1 n=1 Tax=Sistotremastrum niveocremeum HHB9708 TaxID=1314777 RepID=A0A164NTS9_9AGAM|nr:BRO1-domain-containing protein [Sistotremastrum niveocremeum HHB9708]